MNPIDRMSDAHESENRNQGIREIPFHPMNDTHAHPAGTVASTSNDTSPRSFAWYALLALGLALFVRFFVAAPYVVSGASMDPTFHNWDYLITDRVSYRVGEPERGDVIVFCLPSTTPCSFSERMAEGQFAAPRTLIKRIIGLPGETVIVNQEGVRIINEAYPQGIIINEPYISAENLGGPSGVNMTLGPNEFFVMGDNRRVSSDSRVWGALPREDIVGRVLVRLFPVSKASVLPGDANYAFDSASGAAAPLTE